MHLAAVAAASEFSTTGVATAQRLTSAVRGRRDHRGVLRAAVGCCVVAVAAAGAALLDHGHIATPAAAVPACGGFNRWDVKTLSDLRRPNPPVLKRDAELRTIDYLVTQPHAKIGQHTHASRASRAPSTCSRT